MNKFKFNDLKKTKNKNNWLTIQIFFNLQNHPIFHSKEKLVNIVRGRECFVGLSILLVYDCTSRWSQGPSSGDLLLPGCVQGSAIGSYGLEMHGVSQTWHDVSYVLGISSNNKMQNQNCRNHSLVKCCNIMCILFLCTVALFLLASFSE